MNSYLSPQDRLEIEWFENHLSVKHEPLPRVLRSITHHYVGARVPHSNGSEWTDELRQSVIDDPELVREMVLNKMGES